MQAISETDPQRPVVAIVGPTASGKTSFAVSLASACGGEIVSCDSRQVYRGMDLGTGKDLDEYGEVPYHLIDILPAGEVYNLFRFLDDASAAVRDIQARGRIAVLCGGTGMYVESFLKGMSLPEVPENRELRARLADKSLAELTEILAGMKTLHNVTDVDTAKRAIRAIEIQQYYIDHPELAPVVDSTAESSQCNHLIVGISIDREARRERIARRLNARLEAGMIEEVERLLADGVPAAQLINYGLEYKFLTNYVQGRLSRKEMEDGLLIAIHQFAKRQMTWFRGMERRGLHIEWFPYDMPKPEFIAAVLALYNNRFS